MNANKVEHGIIMSGDNPKLILERRKTHSRRKNGLDKINDFPDRWKFKGFSENQYHLAIFTRISDGDLIAIPCPYGVVGDRLWVKEKFSISGNGYFYAEQSDGTVRTSWTSARFMPRKASRITLEITKVRVERLQDISEEDAMAEGCFAGIGDVNFTAVSQYQKLWDSLHGKGAWASNDWVWVIEFRLDASKG